jgi:long-chain acyl-CoA synthetase
VPDEASGEAIIAAVVIDPTADHKGARLDPAMLPGYVADRLASYKKPREVLVVEAIPRLPSGKALRRLLKDSYLKEKHGRATIG